MSRKRADLSREARAFRTGLVLLGAALVSGITRAVFIEPVIDGSLLIVLAVWAAGFYLASAHYLPIIKQAGGQR